MNPIALSPLVHPVPTLPLTAATPECPDSGIPAGSLAVDSARRLPGALSSLSVVLACRDDATSVAAAIQASRIAGSRCAHAVEVIVVDDGSRDETVDAAMRLAGSDRDVRVCVHPHPRGRAATLATGIAVARMEWILLLGADLEIAPAELEALLPAASAADVVTGWRSRRDDPLPHRLADAAWGATVRYALGLRSRDPGCRFVLVRRKFANASELQAAGAAFTPALLARAGAAGARVAEVGVHHSRPTGRGHAERGRGPSALLALFALRRSLRRLARAG